MKKRFLRKTIDLIIYSYHELILSLPCYLDDVYADLSKWQLSDIIAGMLYRPQSASTTSLTLSACFEEI